MGSLMGGWNSSIEDPKAVKYQRNRSMTKEGIETYWRSKKQNEEHHNKEEDTKLKEFKRTYERSISMPVSDTKENFLDRERENGIIQKNGWWISSKWAFLNESPVIESEGPIYKYASQYHLATKDSSKPQPSSGIST